MKSKIRRKEEKEEKEERVKMQNTTHEMKKEGKRRRGGVSAIRKRFLLSVSISFFPFTSHLYQSSGL